GAAARNARRIGPNKKRANQRIRLVVGQLPVQEACGPIDHLALGGQLNFVPKPVPHMPNGHEPAFNDSLVILHPRPPTSRKFVIAHGRPRHRLSPRVGRSYSCAHRTMSSIVTGLRRKLAAPRRTSRSSTSTQAVATTNGMSAM